LSAIRFVHAVFAALGLCGLLAVPAGAATFKPTRFDDPIPNGCKPQNCSLREALAASNSHQGLDTVVLRRGTYEMEIPPTGVSGTGSFDLIDGLVLRGEGRGKTKIDANGLDRVAECFLDSRGDSYTLRDLTLTRGDAGPDPHSSGGGLTCGGESGDEVHLARAGITHSVASENGGGYQVGERTTVTIVDSRISDNEAFRGGGMILLPRADGSEVTIRDSIITGNEAAFGGGIYSGADRLTIQRTTISDNAGDEGGGMDLVASPDQQPVTDIRSSTISGNSARKGGGLLADGNQPGLGQQKPVATLLNSTVALNHTSAEGGGILADNEATVTLDQATIAYNMADDDNINGGVAGGVYQHSGATFGLADSIVAKNVVGSSGTAAQCEGTFTATAGGVVESQPNGSCVVPGSFVTPDALIGVLADNGGPTETIRLLAGSPAIGFAHEGCPKKDQRGVRRPAEDCDSGAFERRKP
jgi:hypothetical protein